jgi:hypothetical protein
MRLRPALLILFAIAALVSSAVAGIAGLLLTAIAMAGPAAIYALILVPYAALVGIKWTGATALILGAILSICGEKWRRARHGSVWAATGVAGALAHYFLPWPEIVDSFARGPELRTQFWWLPLIFILSGIAAALAFRSTIRLGGLFVADEDEI